MIIMAMLSLYYLFVTKMLNNRPIVQHKVDFIILCQINAAISFQNEKIPGFLFCFTIHSSADKHDIFKLW